MEKRPLPYIYSTAIAKWSQQISNFHPLRFPPGPASSFNLTDASPLHPYKPCQSAPKESSDKKDQSHISELNQRKNGLELLIDACNFIESSGTTYQTTDDANALMETSTISQDEVRDNDFASFECESGWENLLMLADESVKRIEQERKREQ